MQESRQNSPQQILYETITKDGSRTVVYMPVQNSGNIGSYTPRPLPRTDWSFMYPILSVVTAVTGQYFGFRTTESMYNFLTSQTKTPNNVTYDSSITGSYNDGSNKTEYGNYSGNGLDGYNASKSVVKTGNTDTTVTDSFKLKTTDNSQKTDTETVVPPVVITPTVVPQVITPTVIQPTVITPVITNSTEE